MEGLEASAGSLRSARRGAPADPWPDAGRAIEGSGHSSAWPISRLDTATWQLPVLPSVPEYWRLTPTACFPCFGNPVSSIAITPRRSGITSFKRSHRGWSCHGEWGDEVLQRLIVDRLAQAAMHRQGIAKRHRRGHQQAAILAYLPSREPLLAAILHRHGLRSS
jgi:hypothetical protein